MDSTLKLTTYKMATNTRKVLALAKYAKVTLQTTYVDRSDESFSTTISKSSTNSLPLLETSEGQISETGAILQYLGAKGGVAGTTDFERAQVTQWLAFSYQEIGMCRMHTVYPILGYVEYDAEKNKMFSDMLKSHLKALDKHLTSRNYLVGDNATVADFELWANLLPLWQLVFPNELRTKLFPNVEKWFMNFSKQDYILSTFGPTHTCKAVQKPPRVEKKPELKKEEKKPEVKKEEKPVDEKPKDPLAGLPASKMDFDAFKKDFMNSKNRTEVMERFWKETLDKEGFSLYYTKYQKLPNEGKVLFKTGNGASFFLQKNRSF
jgi:glutathione S-transferase